jgi:hypothetical protein
MPQDQVTPDQFAERIKQKYPQYKTVPNADLTNKFLAKYPEYKDRVAAPPAAQPQTKPTDSMQAWKPSLTERAGELGRAAFGLSPKQTAARTKAVSGALPSVGATIGAVAGGPIGAGIGGAVGKAAETGHLGKDVAITGLEQAGLEYLGGAAAKGLTKIAAKAGGRAAEVINNYIGLKKGSLPKFGRTVQNAQDIGNTVLATVGVKGSLPEQRAAIEATRQAYDNATQKLVQTPGGKLMDVHSLLYDRAVKLLTDAEKEGVTKEQLGAIDKNLEALLEASKPGGKMSPAEMHAMRKDLQKQITDWNPQTLNIRQRFLQGAYHDLNDAITRTLPAKESRAFLSNNRIQSKLITARQAADNKLLEAATTKGEKGPVTKASSLAARMTIGAVGGAATGEAAGGHVKEGAVAGAVLGGLSARVGDINLPRLDVKALDAARAAKGLAPIAKLIPQAMRTTQAIKDIQDRPPQ